MGIRITLLGLLILLGANFCRAQINWNTIDDSIDLSPPIYVVNGSATINYLGKIITEDNKIQIDFKSKVIFLNNFSNLFKFSFGEIASLFISDGDQFDGKLFFENEFKEKVVKSYRNRLYASLNLNEVTFTYSKRNKIEMTKEGKLYVKNEKQKSGKICAVGFDFITILAEDGELFNLENGDFNSLQTINSVFKDCKSLYDLVFENFKGELKSKIEKWQSTTLGKDINTLIENYGPITSIKQINSDLTQYEWSWPRIIYNIDINTRSRQLGLNSYSRTTNYFGSAYSSLFGSLGSSLFLYGNSNRSSSSESESSGITSTVTNTSQNGTVVMSDKGAAIKIIKDKNGRSINLSHTNIFSDLDYGKPFKFINY
jgi:hypothetical protein